MFERTSQAPVQVIDEDENWQSYSSCTPDVATLFSVPDTSTFGREMLDERKYRERAAKAICRLCPVQRQCLEDAIAAETVDDSIHGGLTPREIKKLRRKVA